MAKCLFSVPTEDADDGSFSQGISFDSISWLWKPNSSTGPSVSPSHAQVAFSVGRASESVNYTLSTDMYLPNYYINLYHPCT